MMERREKRIRPLTDDKVLLGWNALMNTACSKAFAATGAEAYRQLAVRNMEFLLQAFSRGNTGGFYHTWKNGQARYPAFLDDMACLTEALLHLQEITGDTGWLEKAEKLCGQVITHFRDPGIDPGQQNGSGIFFCYTPESEKDVLVRKKEIYDGAQPSGNSLMAVNLYRMGILLDRPEWKNRAAGMLQTLGLLVEKYPGSFGNWACLALEIQSGTSEIVIAGKDPGYLHQQVLAAYIPHRVLMLAKTPVSGYPLLQEKPLEGPAVIYHCSNYTCSAPVFSATGLISLINRDKKR